MSPPRRGTDHDARHPSCNSHPSLRSRDYDSGAPISDISSSQSNDLCRRYQGMVASSGRRHWTNGPRRYCKHSGGLKVPSPLVKEAIVKRHPRVELVREALGAIADRLPAVFCLYIDCEGRWSVRNRSVAGQPPYHAPNRERGASRWRRSVSQSPSAA